MTPKTTIPIGIAGEDDRAAGQAEAIGQRLEAGRLRGAVVESVVRVRRGRDRRAPGRYDRALGDFGDRDGGRCGAAGRGVGLHEVVEVCDAVICSTTLWVPGGP